jgi:transposase-like protein
MFMSPVPRAALAPLTSKQPLACPRCGSRNITRRGRRKEKLEFVQLWRCSACKHVFTPGPAALRNKTYPPRMILAALSDYDLGYSLEETAARLKKKSGRNVAPSTISAWLETYKARNDSVTLAIEVPIWLDERNIGALEREHRIELALVEPNKDRAITGHIDFLQVRNGCVHILD